MGENSTDAVIDYSQHGPVLFSMNQGDYSKPAMDNLADEFRALALQTDGNPFDELFTSVQFEDVGKGRQGNVLVQPDDAGGIPIVRTTTKYSVRAQCFQPVHARLARQIQTLASLPVCLNNALVENYTNAYATMGFHSDQELDMEEGSAIALFSCYRHPELASPPRQLVIESKEPGGGTFQIPMTHNSVVVWSLDTNRRYRHKIVLDTAAHPPDNLWLGVTFRTSNTFVRFRDERAWLGDGTPLTLADEDQRREFFTLRRQENGETNFSYPRLTYTISESDMMPPKPSDDKI